MTAMRIHRNHMGRAATSALVLFVALVMCAAPAALASPTRAGTVITNQARIVFNDLAGTEHEVLSNTVETVVRAVAGVDITPGATVVAAPGATARFDHIVTNTGNSPDTFDITVTGPGGYAIVAGFERDGSVYTYTAVLEPGESAAMRLTVQVPSSIPLSTLANFVVTAASRLDSAVTHSADDVVAVSEARPRVDVHGSPVHAYLGSEYTFNITFGNDGDIALAGATLQSPIPAALEFISAGGAFTYDPVQRKLTWPIGQIAAGQSATFAVRVRVISAAPGITYVLNSATLAGDDVTSVEDHEPTGLVTSAPAAITLTADPTVIPGDGWSTSLLTATVVDVLGNPVPDGTPVSFSTELGSFVATGSTSYVTSVVGGQATAVLLAPLMSGFVQTSNTVVVKAGTPAAGEAQQTITVVFSPAGVTGIVLDNATGAPLAGLLVELRDADGNVVFTTHTGDDGRYLLIAPATGSYVVAITLPYGSGTRVVEMPVEVDYLNGTLFTTANALLGSVVELAAGARGGASLAGAAVSLFGSSGTLVASAIADSEGRFAFANLPLDSYTLIARAVDGRIGLLTVDMSEPGEVVCDAIIWMYVPGLVFDALTHAAIPGASVELVFASGANAGQLAALPAYAGLGQTNPKSTGGDGTYIFYAAPGHYVLRVRAFGYEDYLSDPFVLVGGAANVVNMDVPMVRLPSDGLELTKTADPMSVDPGEPIHFGLEWRNVAGIDLTNVVLVDQLPPALHPDVASISHGGVYEPGSHTITWIFPLAPAGAGAVTVTFEASADTATADGTLLLNRAEARAADGSMAASAVSVLVARMPGMSVLKEADRPSAHTGDMVTYKVAVANSGEIAEPMTAFGVTVRDEMPRGFSYVAGSSMLGGAALADPAISAGAGGSVLTWPLGDIAPGDGRELRYRAIVGPDAAQGDGVNRAFVAGFSVNGYPFEEGPASARVSIAGPAFSQLGTIIGRVYLADGAAAGSSGGSGRDGRGISGVELLMDDGTRVITDIDGLYHVAGVLPGVRSIKLNLADAGSPSQFVRVLPSATTRADFPVQAANEPGIGAIGIKVSLPELVAVANGQRAEVTATVTVSNRGGQPLVGATLSLAGALAGKSGTLEWVDEPVVRLGAVPAGESTDLKVRLTAPGGGATDSLLLAAAVFTPGKVLAQANAVSVLAPPVERSLVSLGYAILSPARQSVSYQGHIPVKVVTPLNEEAVLMVNGKAVGDDRVGTKAMDAGRGTTTLDYVSVKLEAGANMIELVKGGTVIARSQVLVPGPVESAVAVAVPTQSRLAVGARVPVAALALDAAHIPAGRLAGLDAMATGASFVGADLDPREAGFQAPASVHGSYDLLVSVTDPDGKIDLSISAGRWKNTIDLKPLLGREAPAVLAGSAELHLSAAGLASSYAMGRAYARKEFDSYVLTLGIDGAAGRADAYAGGDDGDGAYTLFGDGSVQSDAAPSQGMFYARLAKGESYVMWGDFQSDFTGPELVNRRSALTGLSAAGKLGSASLFGFAAPTYGARFTDLIQGNGSSGYYFLSHYPVVAASESVRIVLTAHNDDSLILETKALTRGADYTMDYEAGAILLALPLPSVHAAGGKVLLEVEYAASSLAQRATAAGVRATVDVMGGALKLGASAVVEAQIGGAGTRAAAGVDAALSLGELGSAFAEVAASGGGEYAPLGIAARARLELTLGQFRLTANAASSDGDFVKPGSGVAMLQQTTVNAELRLDDHLDALASLRTENTWAGPDAEWSNKTSLTLGRKLSLLPEMAVGGIGTVGRSAAGTGLIVDAFAQAQVTPELSARATTQLFKTGVIQDPDGDFTLGLTYETVRGAALTIGYSTAAAVGAGERRRHSFVAALAMDAGADGKVYSRLSLSMGGAAGPGGPHTLTAGYKDTYLIAPGLKLLVAMEGSVPLGGGGGGVGGGATANEPARRAAASGTLDYTAPGGLHALLKQEVALTPAGRTLLTQASVEGKATPWLTLKGDVSAYSGTAPTREGLPLKVEGSVAAAARPLGRPMAGLAMLSGKYYAGERFERDEMTAVGIASTDVSFDIGDRLTLDAKAALKIVGEGEQSGSLSTSTLLLLQAGPSVHIGPKTDLEGFVRALGWSGGNGGSGAGGGADAWRVGWSVQVAHSLVDGLRLGLGYNSADLADTDIADTKPWTEGFYLKAMLKF